MQPSTVDRRQFLQGLGGALALAGIGAPLLAGCGDNGVERARDLAKRTAAVKFPTYTEYKGVTPDLPGSEDGTVPGFLAFPADPVQAIDEKPGTGAAVTTLATMFAAIPPPLGKNRYWQELNKRTGYEINFTMVPDAEYADKFSVIMAGDDLPDIALIPGGAPRRPELLAAKFQDLTEYLSGDAAKEFPYLANIPTDAWKATLYNGGIFGLPMPRAVTGNATFTRNDLIEKRGLDPQPKSFDDFRTLCKELTDDKNSQWALGGPHEILGFVQAMLHIPNGWTEKNGTFSSVHGTEEMKQAIDAVRMLVKDGVFHPDAFASETVKRKEWLGAGKIAITPDGYSAWPGFAINFTKLDPKIHIDAIVAPGFDGGPGTHGGGGTSFGVTALKKGDKSRIKEVLRLCNWMAAPFGTKEFMFRKYGIEGVHYTLNGSDPAPNSTGQLEVAVPTGYIVDAPYVLYIAGMPDAVKAWHAYQQRAIPILVRNPTVGLYSDTAGSKGAEIDEKLRDLRGEIMQGRQPLSAFDEGVAAWKKGGGDQIKREFEESYAQFH